MVSMFEHVMYAIHVQHAQNMAVCLKITKAQNILLNFTVLLLYFCYCNIVDYLGYGYRVYMGTAQTSRGQCLEQSGPMPAGAFEGNVPPLFLSIYWQIFSLCFIGTWQVVYLQ